MKPIINREVNIGKTVRLEEIQDGQLFTNDPLIQTVFLMQRQGSGYMVTRVVPEFGFGSVCFSGITDKKFYIVDGEIIINIRGLK